MVQGHLPPGGPSPASGLLKVNKVTKTLNFIKVCIKKLTLGSGSGWSQLKEKFQISLAS